MKIIEKYEIKTDKLDYENSSGNGMECNVFDCYDDNIVFKLYDHYSRSQVKMIIQFNREYAEQGLAPEVLSGVIEIDGQFGYFTERVLPEHQVDDYEERGKHITELADSLEFDNVPLELCDNWGLTKDRRPVLLDFGLKTLEFLGLYDGE